MKKEEPRKGVFITIVVLLVIFLPLSVVSFVLYIQYGDTIDKKSEENPNHEFFYNNQLYFYNKEDTLLGKYVCKNSSSACGLASSVLDDHLYSLDYYKSTELEMDIINDRYVFLIDDTNLTDAKPFLYDILNERIMTTYSSVKNYGIGIEDDLFVVADANLKYAVLSLAEEPKIVVPFDYDFLGIANLVNQDKNKIMKDLFVGYKEGKWYLVDPSGAVLTVPINDEIVSYNGQSIITKHIDGFSLVNYRNINILPNEVYQKLSFTGKYLNILEESNEFYVFDLSSNASLMDPIVVKETDQITTRISDDKLEVILNDEVVKTLSIS